MKTKPRTTLTALISLFFLGTSCSMIADNYQYDFDAIDRGDHKTAYNLWLPSAEKGDAKAQFNLGLISHQALGGSTGLQRCDQTESSLSRTGRRWRTIQFRCDV